MSIMAVVEGDCGNNECSTANCSLQVPQKHYFQAHSYGQNRRFYPQAFAHFTFFMAIIICLQDDNILLQEWQSSNL